MTPAEVGILADTEVRATRSFAESVGLVWKSFTEPELVRRWMLGPPGWSMPVCEMDFRVGGKYEWRWRNDNDGKEFGFVGEVRAIEMQARIVHTEKYQAGSSGESMADETTVAITFREVSGITTVATSIKYSSKEDRDAALASGMTDGMEMGYCNLDEVLSS